MLPLTILTLALVGGFVFAIIWYPTRYYTLRSDGYHLVFTSAVIAIFFLFVATVLTTAISAIPEVECRVHWIDKAWHQAVPVEHSGKAALAFLFGVSLWWPSNLLGERSRRFRFLSDDAAIEREVKENEIR